MEVKQKSEGAQNRKEQGRTGETAGAGGGNCICSV